MTQHCFKCGRRIEPLNEKGESSGQVIIRVELWYADAYNNKVSQIDQRWYCQDCGVSVKTILENWEGA